jgi:hypothetical protein
MSDWHQLAACWGKDPGLFFDTAAAAVSARLYCGPCPVRADCARTALQLDAELGGLTGTWAGVTLGDDSRTQRRGLEQLRRIADGPGAQIL